MTHECQPETGETIARDSSPSNMWTAVRVCFLDSLPEEIY